MSVVAPRAMRISSRAQGIRDGTHGRNDPVLVRDPEGVPPDPRLCISKKMEIRWTTKTSMYTPRPSTL